MSVRLSGKRDVTACFDLMRGGIAGHHKPSAAARGVMPVFLVSPARIVTQVDVIHPSFRASTRCRTGDCGPFDGEFFLGSSAAVRAGDETCHSQLFLLQSSMKIGLATLALLVDQVAALKAVEPHLASRVVRGVLSEKMREA